MYVLVELWAKQSDNKWMIAPDGSTLLVEEQATGEELYYSKTVGNVGRLD